MSWCIKIHRQTDGGTSPATAESPKGTLLADWEEGGWLDWIHELVKTGKAIHVGDFDGYRCLYTSTAENLIPRIVDDPPGVRPIRNLLVDGKEVYVNTGMFDRAAASACRPDEWLLIDATDLS